MRMLSIVPLWIIFYTIALYGQMPSHGPLYSEQAMQAMKESEKASITLQLDKAIYLPGEAFTLTLVVYNPTTSVLQIPDPFDSRAATFDLWSKEQRWKALYGSEWGPASPSPNVMRFRMDANPPILAIPAGQSITKTFAVGDKPANDSFWMEAVSIYPGQYRIALNYPKAPCVEYRVTPATLEAKFRVSLQGTVSWKIPGILLPGMNPVQTARRATNIAALAGDGGHWIVATKNLSTRGLRLEPGMEFDTEAAGGLSPLIRVAQSANPVVSLSGVADANDNITITWTDSTGKTSSVHVDKDRKIIPAGQ